MKGKSFAKLVEPAFKIPKNASSRKNLILEDPTNENKESIIGPNIKQLLGSDQKSPKALNKIMVEKTDIGQRRLDGQLSKQLVIKDSCNTIEGVKISPKAASPRGCKDPMLMV